MTIKLRRDTAANWTTANPTLAAGQPGWESDTAKLKIGDGTTAWASLAYFSSGGVTDGDKGDITVSGSGATWTIDNGAVSLAKQADMATASVVYRKTAGTGAPEVQTLATLKTDLGLTGTNSGDQTTIVGITGTLSEFNAALTGADFATGGGTATGTNTGDQIVPVNTTATTSQFFTAYDNTTGAFTKAQPVSTDLSDFNSATRAQVEAELIAGTNITITPASSGATRTLTIAAAGGSGTSTGLAMTLAAAAYSM